MDANGFGVTFGRERLGEIAIDYPLFDSVLRFTGQSDGRPVFAAPNGGGTCSRNLPSTTAGVSGRCQDVLQ